MRKNRVDAQVLENAWQGCRWNACIKFLTGAHCLQFSEIDANMLGNVKSTVIPGAVLAAVILSKRSRFVPKEEWVAQCA